MRILFITYELPPLGGGGGRAAWQIARRLAVRGHDVRILTSFFPGLREFEALNGVGIHRIRVRRKRPDACSPLELFSFMARSLPATRRLAEEVAPDVLCAFFAIPGGPAAWRLRKRAPYVVSLRGSDVPRPELGRHQKLHLFTKPVIRRILRDAAGIVAVSRALAEAARPLCPGRAIEVVPNGVDTGLFHPGAPGADTERCDLLFVGRLRRFKGVENAVRALPFVEAALGRPVALTVVGEGEQREELAAIAADLARQGMRSTARFLGWMDQDMLAGVYRRASALILPSLVEGHPNVVLEAMASGVPCIASDAPGMAGLIEDGRDGRLVPPGDTAAFARAAAEILRSPDTRAAMGQAARSKAETFSWDAAARRYEEILDRAATAQREDPPCAT